MQKVDIQYMVPQFYLSPSFYCLNEKNTTNIDHVLYYIRFVCGV